MPTYQYACTECDHRFDAVQTFTDSALTECPECHGRLRKLYGNVGVVFKGSGFYRTDSRSGSGAKTSEPATAAAASSGSESKSSGESKSGGESKSNGDSKSSSTSTSTSTPVSTPAKASSAS